MKRLVQPELLDTLSTEDPAALRSRRDLHRVNAWMRNPTIMARALADHWREPVPQRITELGAGDGKFLLSAAHRLVPHRTGVEITLLDRRINVAPETLAAFAGLGWNATVVGSDVFKWSPAEGDTVVANLFLHHFEDARLAALLGIISRRVKLFIAIEPRRAAWPLFCTRLLWAIGCNYVTRHDATVSVRAGFSGVELSALWPDRQDWQFTEHSVGPFSHLFIAQKIG